MGGRPGAHRRGTEPNWGVTDVPHPTHHPRTARLDRHQRARSGRPDCPGTGPAHHRAAARRRPHGARVFDGLSDRSRFQRFHVGLRLHFGRRDCPTATTPLTRSRPSTASPRAEQRAQHPLLALQRQAGNAAVAGAVHRRADGAGAGGVVQRELEMTGPGADVKAALALLRKASGLALTVGKKHRRQGLGQGTSRRSRRPSPRD